MAKQTFTTGQVLTAAQMTSLQQTAMLGGAASAKTASYTLVADDAGTAISMSNASATTITVNTALFAAGDTVQITNLGAGVCTITAGTATVNTSASLALAQYESGTLDFTSTSAAIFIKGAGAAAASSSGLTLITNQAFTTVSSYSLPANTFTTTYNNYEILLDVTAFSASNNFIGRLRSGSTDRSDADYTNNELRQASTTLTGADTSTTSIPIGDVNSNTNYQMKMTLFKPMLATKKWYMLQRFHYNQAGSWMQVVGAGRIGEGAASLTFDSFSFIPGSGTMTGRVYVYGYNI
jgi:hypothetical protein